MAACIVREVGQGLYIKIEMGEPFCTEAAPGMIKALLGSAGGPVE